MFYSAKFAHIL